MSDVFLNNTFLAADEACVSVFDRGFMLGDGVYEVIPVYAGNVFEMTSHLQRLENSLHAIRMANPHTLEQWQSIIEQLVDRNGGGDQSVYLQVTRGVAPRDHLFPAEDTVPTSFAMSNPLAAVPDSVKTQGVSVISLTDIRWQMCDVKAITLLPNSLLKQQAHEAGAQEALLIRDGYLTEGAASNAYAIIDGIIYTAPKSEKILPGITRDVIIQLAKDNAMPLIEKAVTEVQLQQADEIWVSSSTKEVLPVTKLDGKPVGKGIPGPIWMKMNALYQQNKYKHER